MVLDRLPKPAVVFFDLFGTVFKWSKPPRVAISDALRSEGIEVGPEAVNRARLEIERKLPTRDEWPSEGEAAYWRHFDGELLKRLKIPASPGLLDAIRREFEANVQLLMQDDAFPAIAGLREQGLKVGAISNSTHGMRRDLARLGAERLFDQVVFSQPLNARKPDPHIFLMALSKFGCPPNRAWMVGDDPETDVRGARGVGMVPVLVDRRGLHGESTATRISDLREVVALYGAAEP